MEDLYKLGKLVPGGTSAALEIFKEGKEDSVAAIIMMEGMVSVTPVEMDVFIGEEEKKAYLQVLGEGLAIMGEYYENLDPEVKKELEMKQDLDNEEPEDLYLGELEEDDE